jgi:hypothetical protein
MTAFKLKAPLPTEGDECAALLQWASITRYQQWRLSQLLIMIPNGTKLFGTPKERAMQMARMKRLGFRSGVFDYLLPIPRAPYPGLWLELKRRQLGVVSDEQGLFKLDMEVLGWKTAIAKGWEEAKDAINDYLGTA